MQTVILAGGLGTRLGAETEVRPKPMVRVGGKPLLWHIMKIYAAQGFDDFIVALGYFADTVRDYFLSMALGADDIRVDLKTGRVDRISAEVGWRVTALDTGLSTGTGGRLRRAAEHVDGDVFLATYGDGLADIDLGRLVDFHHSHDRLVTVTAVPAPAQYGYLCLDGLQVSEFREKRHPMEAWINGGFFVIDKRALERVGGDTTSWEAETMVELAREGELMAYRHTGFWRSMDTPLDRQALEELWASGRAKWLSA